MASSLFRQNSTMTSSPTMDWLWKWVTNGLVPCINRSFTFRAGCPVDADYNTKWHSCSLRSREGNLAHLHPLCEKTFAILASRFLMKNKQLHAYGKHACGIDYWHSFCMIIWTQPLCPRTLPIDHLRKVCYTSWVSREAQVHEYKLLVNGIAVWLQGITHAS